MVSTKLEIGKKTEDGHSVRVLKEDFLEVVVLTGVLRDK